MREDRDRQLLKIVRQTVVAPVQKGAGLRGALQHQGATRGDSERELFTVARARDNFQRVVVQTRIDFHLRHGILHRENVLDVGDRIE